VLEELARLAGLNPERAEELAVPYEFPIARSTLERALLAFAPVTRSGPRLPSAWAAKRSRGRLSAFADPMARTGSTTAGGI
jgi:hypothetical protein